MEYDDVPVKMGVWLNRSSRNPLNRPAKSPPDITSSIKPGAPIDKQQGGLMTPAKSYDGLRREELIRLLEQRDAEEVGGIRLTYKGQTPPLGASFAWSNRGVSRSTASSPSAARRSSPAT
jgi:hypothetical protein